MYSKKLQKSSQSCHSVGCNYFSDPHTYSCICVIHPPTPYSSPTHVSALRYSRLLPTRSNLVQQAPRSACVSPRSHLACVAGTASPALTPAQAGHGSIALKKLSVLCTGRQKDHLQKISTSLSITGECTEVTDLLKQPFYKRQ